MKGSAKEEGTDRDFLMLLPYLIAILVPLGLGLFATMRNRGRLVRTFAALLYAQALWALAVLLKILLPDYAGKIWSDNAEFLFAGGTALLTLSVALRFEGVWFKSRATFWILLSLPFLVFLYAATDGWHHHLRPDGHVDTAFPWGELRYTVRPSVFAVLSPLYIMALAGLLRLARLVFRERGTGHNGNLLACFGLLMPIVGSALSVQGVRIAGRLDTSSVWMVAGDLLFLVGIFRQRLGGIVPAAWGSVVENLDDPVLVVDAEGLIVDGNPAAASLAGRDFAGRDFAPGASVRVEAVFSDWPEEARAVLLGGAEEAVVSYGQDPRSPRDFSLRSFRLPGGAGARVVLIRDDTGLRRAERELRELSAGLETKVDERSRELQREVSRRMEVQERLESLNQEFVRTQREILFTLSELVENRGDESARHVARVSGYARILGRARGLPPEAADLLADASAMHDIGKIGIPDSILKKPGPLEAEEVATIRAHTRIGWEILRKSDRDLIKLAATIALEHHERWDGQGYPEGKAGADISLEARIVAICDSFDSLAARTSYRGGWEPPEILAFFREERGRRFDPALVDLLFIELEAFRSVEARLPDLDPSSTLLAGDPG